MPKIIFLALLITVIFISCDDSSTLTNPVLTQSRGLLYGTWVYETNLDSLLIMKKVCIVGF